MINIEGFSPLQKKIADIIWQMNTEEEMVNFYDGCGPELQPIVFCVMNMIRYEYIDSLPMDDLSEANAIINQIKGL